ncbi:AAA family ATPase [Pacificibacter marinus]|uniref:Recombination protein F n=1 Tax=Pacificibacter marinus TaxID=658057 RepID=A0A1Y5TY21_9RHOB|nr:AAA family ATPase [Pacificibacter marinus]SEL43229.1 AAA domain-containing protein, putative AbiEii toxin, Type IV TA system [Pacificibacter marinus]SLN71259.1 recombination protein F [Pacificibacter marinus]
MLRLTTLSIEDIGGISKASIGFHPKMNVICGPNGVGKTTILDIIVHMATIFHSQRLKKRVGAESGSATVEFVGSNGAAAHSIAVKHSDPAEKQHYTGGSISPSDILYLRNYRLFDWVKLGSISSDPDLKDASSVGGRNLSGIPNGDSKNWFVNRYLFSPHENALTPSQLTNLQLAKKSFAVLDPTVQFSHVEASSNEVMVRTPDGLIPYEYLSSGFKTSITIFWGIIKEIEFRRERDVAGAETFDGVILIDELELHLHPVWQSRILQALQTMFPVAQFIVTTHSPHIVQAAESGEVMPLETDYDGSTTVREIPHLEHGLSMWTVEEILEDIMGMSDANSGAFRGVLKNFEQAVLSNKRIEAKKIYDHLAGSVHPQSAIRKVLALQMASLGGLDD